MQKKKQYGAFRAIGLSNTQLAKMIIAEASTYAITGTICGSILGIVCNKILFSKLVTYQWAIHGVPLAELGIVFVVVAIDNFGSKETKGGEKRHLSRRI